MKLTYNLDRILVISSMTLFTISSRAADEYWTTVQIRKTLYADKFLLAEYVRRDFEGYYNTNNLHLYRFSYAGLLDQFNYQLGLAFVDSAKSSDETRLHQHLIKTFKSSSTLNYSLRLGLEERNFRSDNTTYLRTRIRGQANQPILNNFGISMYDELFFALNGPNRFHQGFNENRLGIGLTYKNEKYEIYLYNNFVRSESIKETNNLNWIQLQILFKI